MSDIAASTSVVGAPTPGAVANGVIGTTIVDAPIAIESSSPALSANSQALPFMSRPLALDGSLAGDVGFDPWALQNQKPT